MRIVLASCIVITSCIGLWLVGEKLQEEMEGLALDKLTESVQKSQEGFNRMAEFAESTFSLGVEYDGSVGGLVKMAPLGIVATLYRPYIWESKKLSSLLSSLESLAVMLLTLFVLYKAGLRTFLGSIFKDPMIMYCFWFAIVFALFVGVTTLNFGTLVRYKIPCMPFYIISMVLILERHKTKKLQQAAAKQIQEDNTVG